MKTIIDLNKGYAFGAGKAWEFKSQSIPQQGSHDVPVGVLLSSRRQASNKHDVIPPQFSDSAAENPFHLSSILGDLGVFYIG